jgi:hypothetical protein
MPITACEPFTDDRRKWQSPARRGSDRRQAFDRRTRRARHGREHAFSLSKARVFYTLRLGKCLHE